jgi:hypothetical protein
LEANGKPVEPAGGNALKATGELTAANEGDRQTDKVVGQNFQARPALTN